MLTACLTMGHCAGGGAAAAGWQLSMLRSFEGGKGALTRACFMSICVHMLSRHNWRIYGTSWKRGGAGASMAGTRSNCSLFSLDVVAIFAIVHCVRLLCSLFYFVLTNQTCKLLDSSSRFALTAAASWERTARLVWHVAWRGMRQAAGGTCWALNRGNINDFCSPV